MVQAKQPVIQSVFDRKLQSQDDTFFIKAIQELEGYRRELSAIAPSTKEYKALVLNRDDREEAMESVHSGMRAAEGVLRGVLNSFDILGNESVL